MRALIDPPRARVGSSAPVGETFNVHVTSSKGTAVYDHSPRDMADGTEHIVGGLGSVYLDAWRTEADMKAIVADAYGVRVTSMRWQASTSARTAGPRSTCDQVVATTGDVVVRYRDDGREVQLVAGQTYNVEAPRNDDVIDVRDASTTVDALLRAMQGIGTDEQRIYDVLGAISGIGNKVAELKAEFESRTGRSLEQALRDELSGAELDRALALIS
jgi:hypothetical protein